MKTLKTLFLTLILAIGLTSTASATKDTVIYNGSTTVNGVPSTTMTVNIGDTIVFQSAMLLIGKIFDKLILTNYMKRFLIERNQTINTKLLEQMSLVSL